MGWAMGLLAFAVAITLLWWRARLPRTGYLAACEYWVYLPDGPLPKQEPLMTRMISDNPYMRPGRPPIGAREGMLFTDIRLGLGLVLRSKNPQLFRPDLFAEALMPTKECLHALAASNALARARYISDEALADDRHLQFMPHLAGAIMGLCGGLAVYDPVLERLWTAEEFDTELARTPNAARIDLHLRVAWVDGEDGFRARTKGLRKVGLPELILGPMDADQEALCLSVLSEAAGRLWKAPVLVDRMEVEAFGDTFELRIEPPRDGSARVRLARLRERPMAS